ncbi:hypothetical protein ACYPKM_03195 [Pseudomonas aeruginosa]
MSPILGSLAALKAGKTRGFVGYPRRYELGDTPENSWVYGVDQAGEQFKMRLDPPQRFIEAAKTRKDRSVPSLANLASLSRSAKNPCNASENNGPGTVPAGAFVAEQASFLDEENNIVSAAWLSILKNYEEEADKKPKICTGYLEINSKFPYTPEVEKAKKELHELNLKVIQATTSKLEMIDGMHISEFIEARNNKVAEFLRMRERHWFVGNDVQFSRLAELDLLNQANARRTILEMLESNSFSGMYGSVLIRPYRISENGQKVVDVHAVRRINHMYDYKKGCVPDVTVPWDDFIKSNGSWFTFLSREKMRAEIIPIQRTNCGPITNGTLTDEYDAGQLKALKFGVDAQFHCMPYLNFAHQNAYLVSPIAIRNAAVGATNDTILSTLHAYGKPFGNILVLDKDLERTMALDKPIAPRGQMFRKETASSMEP